MLLSSVFALLLSTVAAAGDLLFWTRTSNWNNPDNWIHKRVPCSAETVEIKPPRTHEGKPLPDDFDIHLDADVTLKKLLIPVGGSLFLTPGFKISFSTETTCKNEGFSAVTDKSVNSFVGVQPNPWSCVGNWRKLDGTLPRRPPCRDDTAVFQSNASFSWIKLDSPVTVGQLLWRGQSVSGLSDIPNSGQYFYKSNPSANLKVEPSCLQGRPALCPCLASNCSFYPTTPPPTTPKPGTQKPQTQKPQTQKPGTQKPQTQKPGTQKPQTQKPGTQKPQTQKPGTQKPQTQKPQTQKPQTQKPQTQKPQTQKPQTQKPGSQKPQTQKPGTQKPSTGKPPVSGKPSASREPGEPTRRPPGSREPTEQPPETERICNPETGICTICIGENCRSEELGGGGSLPLWVIIVAAVGGVLLLFILILVVVFVRRRKRQPEYVADASDPPVSDAKYKKTASQYDVPRSAATVSSTGFNNPLYKTATEQNPIFVSPAAQAPYESLDDYIK
ncbi:cadherin-related family member 5-like [Oscarella lobularis]|uniref:cadherin-related family member 5-like n=1 Tax=Oscarella lobularis TaxID=121494 RepID=UPI00331400D7